MSTHDSDSDSCNRRTALGSLLATCGALGAPQAIAADPVAVDLATARAEHEAGRAVLIDIREPMEHAGGVARGAQLLPMRQLAVRISEIPTDPKRPVLVICTTQNRSSATVRVLRERGFFPCALRRGGHVRMDAPRLAGRGPRTMRADPTPDVDVGAAPTAGTPVPPLPQLNDELGLLAGLVPLQGIAADRTGLR